jgi:hypothetical protein
MAGTDDQEWSPKTRDDWTGLFSDAFESAQERLTSKREEAEAKAAADAAASSADQTGKGGGSDANGGKGDKRKSFAERLLG